DAAGNKGTQTIKVTYTPAVSTSTTLVLTVGADIVSVNGKATSIDAAPEIVNSRTFVPIRFISETFGATVEWLAETQGITITLGDSTIGLQIGNATAVIDGNIISLPAAPYIKNGRTMVPLRVISEAFGGDVVWDAALRTITITYQP
ncbi:MAG: copper amine oxidase N-terminal domain-containing protein, partial [Candidatus Cryosericum sp.]|nr:copper amine oxidase N-terminal domain-containing protein [bacterium]